MLTLEGLHPYFGPISASGIPADLPDALRGARRQAQATNKFGFVSPHDYPFVKTRDDQVVIGIFGGLVGVWFYQAGATRLIEALRRHPYFSNRELVPLCLSHEGYKQPQQLLVLSYFLSIGQTFDLVVNIDGFNEVALSSLNEQRGLDLSMPSVMHLEPLKNLVDRSTLTPDRLESLAAIGRYRRRLNALAERTNANHVAAVHVALADRRYAAPARQRRRDAVRGHRGQLGSIVPPHARDTGGAGRTAFRVSAA